MSVGTRQAEVATVAVFGPSGRLSVTARRKGSEIAMVPDNVVYRWEAAYRRYGHASKAAAKSVAGDRNAALEMAAASREVAAAWREIEAIADVPWWTLAALSAAAQAFEFQARDWSARAAHGWSADRATRSDVWPPSRAFPAMEG